MTVEAQPVDAEQFVVAYLADRLGTEADVGIAVPADWTPASKQYVQVVSDGVFSVTWPIVTRTTIRLVARAGSPTAAKALCALAWGLLCSHPGDSDIVATRPQTGPLPARDPDTRAELCSATCRVSTRTTSL